MCKAMYFIIVVLAVLVVLLLYYLMPKKREVKEEKINRCATKCFDCVNNSQSLTHLNVSHGYPRVYAT